ncbi:unnamed protein product [Effrenium voratum]|nr:unnamed protein product [Effrenium voratum]
MGLIRPASQGCSRRLPATGSVYRPSSAASLEPWSIQDRGQNDSTVVELPTAEKSPASLAKFARQRQRSIGNLLDSYRIGSSQSLAADTPKVCTPVAKSSPRTDLTSGASVFSDTGRSGLLTPISGDAISKGSADSVRSWKKVPRKSRNTAAWPSAGGRLDPAALCRDQLAQEAIFNRRKLKANESDVLFKKANAAKALAMDRQRAEENKKEAKESIQDFQARRRLDVERQLRRLFYPIHNPHEHLMEYVQKVNVDLTGKTRRVRTAKHEPIIFVEMEPMHQTEVMSLCHHFSSLTRPFLQSGEADNASILTRPAFCRMLIELTIADTAGNVMYQMAIDIFDSLAAQHSLKGSPLTSATVLGIVVDDHTDRVLQLFAMLLATASRESKGATPDEFKLHLLECLLPNAERKFRRRQKHIESQLAQGKDLYRRPLREKDMFEDEAEAIAEQTPTASAGPDSPNMSSPAYSRAPTKRLSADPASRMSSRAKPDREEARRESQMDEDPDLPKSPRSMWSDGLSVFSDDGDERKGQTEEDALYAHTCSVSKGEYLTSMFLEPEIIQLVWMYFDSFEYLFNVYFDTPTNFLLTPAATEGHMSNEAFLQFCIDFQLFPQIIDFNSLNCYYQSAESIIELTREEIKKCRRERLDLQGWRRC